MKHEFTDLSSIIFDAKVREHVLTALIIVIGYGLLAFSHNPFGWLVLVFAFACSCIRLARQEWIYYTMIILSLGVVYMTPFHLGGSIPNIFVCLTILLLALAIPYVGSHRLFRHSLIHFRLSFRGWSRLEFATFLGSVIIAIAFLAGYLLVGDAYKHWKLDTTYDIVVAFTLIMLIGMWEEFYFIASVFGVFKKFMPVVCASALQAVLFSGFLYQFGFQGWIVPFTLIYAFVQGLTFYRFRNLALNLSIHFCVDLAVFIFLMIRLHIG